MEDDKMEDDKQVIFGIDLSLRATGVVGYALNTKTHAEYLIKSSGDHGIERLLYIEEEIEKILDEVNSHLGIKVVVIEGYGFGARGRALFDLGELGGIIKRMVYLKRLPCVIVPPTVLKKFVTGAGNSHKEVMLLKTYKKWGVEFTDNNLCDAYGLARIGEVLVNGAKTKIERDVIKKVGIVRDYAV